MTLLNRHGHKKPRIHYEFEALILLRTVPAFAKGYGGRSRGGGITKRDRDGSVNSSPTRWILGPSLVIRKADRVRRSFLGSVKLNEADTGGGSIFCNRF